MGIYYLSKFSEQNLEVYKMRWTGWVAALGGLLSLGYYLPSVANWMVPLGAIVAIIFGIWAVYE